MILQRAETTKLILLFFSAIITACSTDGSKNTSPYTGRASASNTAKSQPNSDELEQELSKVGQVQQTSTGLQITILKAFEPTGDQLKPEATKRVADIGKVIASHPERKVRVEGYTDNVGSKSENKQLSTRQALAVQDVLLNQGVKPYQIVAIGFGEDHPVGNNETPQGRTYNRRVELTIESPPA